MVTRATAPGGEAVTALECVYQHRLLSTAQLAVMLDADARRPRRTQELLADLAARGLLGFVGQRGVSHRPMRLWFVTPRGADVVEAVASRVEPRRRLLSAEQAAGHLQQHTLAVNEVGLAFLRAARQRSGDECGPLAWRHEIAHPTGGRRGQVVIADAVLRYLHARDRSRVALHYRFVELDRATMPVDALAAKVGQYARLQRFTAPGQSEPAWRAHYPAFPAVCVVLSGASSDALTRRLQTTVALCRTDPTLTSAEVSVSLCLLDDLQRHGPFAPVFTSLRQPDLRVDWLGHPERGA